MYNFLAEIVRFLIMYIINIYCTDPCEQVADFRAQQCQHLFEVVSMDILAVDLQLEQVIMYVHNLLLPIFTYLLVLFSLIMWRNQDHCNPGTLMRTKVKNQNAS